MKSRPTLNDDDIVIINHAFDVLLSDYDGADNYEELERKVNEVLKKIYKNLKEVDSKRY